MDPNRRGLKFSSNWSLAPGNIWNELTCLAGNFPAKSSFFSWEEHEHLDLKRCGYLHSMPRLIFLLNFALFFYAHTSNLIWEIRNNDTKRNWGNNGTIIPGPSAYSFAVVWSYLAFRQCHDISLGNIVRNSGMDKLWSLNVDCYPYACINYNGS